MLGILAAALGPIFAKELVEVARRKRYYLNRTLYGLVLLFVLFVIWKDHVWEVQSRGILSHRAMAELAAKLFQAVSIIQFSAVFVFVPLFTSGVLAGEREAQTLDLLFTTRLTDGQIVLGKLFSRLAVLASLILCGLPVLSLVMFFGGIDPDALWRSIAVTLLATLFVGAHAIYFSAVTRSPLGALVRTYWWLVVELLAVPLAVAMLVKASGIRPTHPMVHGLFGTLFVTNPVALFVTAVNGGAYNQIASAVGEWFFPLSFALPAAGSLFLVWRAVVRLRIAAVPFRWPIPRFVRSLFARKACHSFASRRPRFFGLVRNPLWVRARQARVYDREGYIARVQRGGWLVALGFLVLVAVAGHRGLRDTGSSMPFLGFAWGGVVTLGVLLAGASLASDRSRGLLDLMLVTPLTGREFIDGTLLAVWEHLRRVFWLPFALAFVFCLTGASHPSGAVCSAVTAALFLALAVLYGVGCSLSARSVPAALAAAFVLPLAINIGVAVLIGVVGRGHAPILWLSSACLLVVGWWRFRRSAGVAAVCCYLLAVHLVLANLAIVWTGSFPDRECPGAAMHPGFWTMVWLDYRPGRGIQVVRWFAAVVCYWGALAVNLFWARRWLIRHFDRLAGRGATSPRPPATMIASKLRAARRARERDHVADVGHTAQEEQRPLQT